MRNLWKLLSSRRLPRLSPPTISILRAPPLPQVRSPQLLNPFFPNPRPRPFSSAPAPAPAPAPDLQKVGPVLAEIDPQSLDQESALSALRNLEECPDKARELFDWLLERETKENRILRSKSFNLMLEIVGKKGNNNNNVEEFWRLVKIMEEKGYGIAKGTFLKVSERFKSDGLEKDLNLLKELYGMKSPKIVAAKVRKMLLKEEEDSVIVHKKLGELGINLSADLVVDVLDQIGSHPRKALIFFRWVEENPAFQIDGRVSNVMARVLGREDCIREFWEVLNKMRNSRFELEKETFVKVIDRFYKRKMVSSALELYAFAMAGRSERPQSEDFVYLLKKIMVAKELDVSLASKVVRIYMGAGNVTRVSIFDSVIKSLRSMGRLGECDKVLKAMEEGGFKADTTVYGRVVAGLNDAGKLDEALEYTDKLERSGKPLDLNTWSSLVQRNCFAGHLDKSLDCFNKMVERKGGENVGRTFEVLVQEVCKRKSAEDALNMLKEMVTKKNVQPWNTTYKFLIEKLLSHGKLKEASSLLDLMKSHGFPPFIEPFIRYVSKSGTADEAMLFLKAMTKKDYPSTNVFLSVFEALLKKGRHQVAHDLHSLSPGFVRNHADVLELFYSMKLDEASTVAAL